MLAVTVSLQLTHPVVLVGVVQVPVMTLEKMVFPFRVSIATMLNGPAL